MNSALSTRPVPKGSPSACSVSSTTEKRSPLRSERRKSMLPENSSATCTATTSGMFAASVAANSELWMTPPAGRLLAVRLAFSMRVPNCSPLRSTIRRRKLPLPSGTQRTVRRISRGASVGSAEYVVGKGGVAAQKGGGGRVGHAQALQQGLRRIAAAPLLGAKQREAGGIELAEHQILGQRWHGVVHHAHRQLGRIRPQGRYGKSATTAGEQQGRDSGGHPPGMLPDGARQLVEQGRAGAGQAMNQRSTPG